MRRALRLATAIVAFYAESVSAGALDFSGEAPCEMTIRFASPADWVCRDSDGCTLCTNRADHATDLWVHCNGDASPPERRSVPAGAALSVCYGSVRHET